MSSEFSDNETYSYFLDEAQDLLQLIEQDLLTLKEDPSPNKVNNIMRSAHTLKGAAASVGLDTIKEISHVLEDVFKTLYNPDVVIDDEIESLLFQGYECLRLPLTAYVGGNERVDESSMLNRAANVITQLQEKLGDRFDSNPPLPTSTDLGFDVVQSIFETGVEEKLTAIENASPDEVGDILRQKAEVFLGLGESLNLPGFSAIASSILAALDLHPQEVELVAQIALADLRAGQKLVLAGDRDGGGSPSPELLELAGESTAETSSVTQAPEDLEIETEKPEIVTVIEHGDAESIETISVEPVTTEDISPATPLGEISGDTPAEVETDTETETPVTLEPAITENINPALGLGEIFGSTPPKAQTNAAEIDSQKAVSLDTLLDRVAIGKSESGIKSTEQILTSATTVSKQPNFVANTSSSFKKDRQQQSAKTNRQPEKTKSASVRVELEQLERLNHLAGELLINQNQQTNQDKQLRVVVQELLTQLTQHQQTLNELRDWSDRRWLSNRNFDESSQYKRINSSWQSMFDPLEMDRYNDLQVLIQKAVDESIELENHAELIFQSGKQSSRSREAQQRLLTHVRDDLTAARMQPLGDLFNRFPRLLKQLASVHKKQAQLVLSGSDVLVDKAIVEKLYDPLLHLIRNAFDHGIDDPETRKACQKPEVGTIEIRAYHLGNRTIIEVKDDGQGINFAKIAKKAVQAGFITAEQQNTISESQLLSFLFRSGFSTASELSELSGRGVGLDVVRSQLEALNGSVTVNSVPNSGTTFTLEIPLSLTITKLLVCQTNGVAYAIPVNTVEQILIPGADQFRVVGQNIQDPTSTIPRIGDKVTPDNYLASNSGVSQQLVLHWQQNEREILVPIYKLSDLTRYSHLSSRFLQQNANADLMETEGLLTSHSPIVILRSSEGLFGLQIEQLLGEKELVIRTLGVAVNPPAYLYGCCILSNTSLALVIDAEKLIQHQEKVRPKVISQLQGSVPEAPLLLSSSIDNNNAIEVTPALAPVKKANLLLVVDDSLTLRTTLSKTLQKFGYQVIQAENGRDGLNKLKQKSEIDLVICDIEMPHLNGLEFLNIVNQDRSVNNTPVVMLTSRSADKYRQIASELGASAYLTKPFIDKELHSTIAKLLSSSN